VTWESFGLRDLEYLFPERVVLAHFLPGHFYLPGVALVVMRMFRFGGVVDLVPTVTARVNVGQEIKLILKRQLIREIATQQFSIARSSHCSTCLPRMNKHSCSAIDIKPGSKFQKKLNLLTAKSERYASAQALNPRLLKKKADDTTFSGQ
jgi:hypothetical protein